MDTDSIEYRQMIALERIADATELYARDVARCYDANDEGLMISRRQLEISEKHLALHTYQVETDKLSQNTDLVQNLRRLFEMKDYEEIVYPRIGSWFRKQLGESLSEYELGEAKKAEEWLCSEEAKGGNS